MLSLNYYSAILREVYQMRCRVNSKWWIRRDLRGKDSICKDAILVLAWMRWASHKIHRCTWFPSWEPNQLLSEKKSAVHILVHQCFPNFLAPSPNFWINNLLRLDNKSHSMYPIFYLFLILSCFFTSPFLMIFNFYIIKETTFQKLFTTHQFGKRWCKLYKWMFESLSPPSCITTSTTN
jgi:hypothetical protein